jgi:AcrR family transcriptional regulator
MAATTKARPRPRVDRRTRSARAQKRDARADLLDAALAVVAQRGYRDSSVDEIAERAGYSKGAVYWHFDGKDDLFLALLEERLDRPWLEAIEVLASGPPEQDMSVEASRLFSELLRKESEALLLDQEYWSQAVRDPKLRARYARRQRRIRTALGRALSARLEHLGAPPSPDPEAFATAVMGLMRGLAQERLVEPAAAPDELLGDTLALLYAGHVARTHPTR